MKKEDQESAQEQEGEVEKPNEAAEAPTGRSAFLSSIKANEPDYEPKDDEDLFNKANEMHGELQKHRDATEKIRGNMMSDPRVGALHEIMGSGKSSAYAIGKLYGPDLKEMEGKDLEEFEEGYQETLKSMGASKKAQEEAQKNIESYFKDLDDYCKEEGKSEEEKTALNEKIYALADNFLNGIITKENIKLIDDGDKHDEHVQDALDTGAAEGRNQKIDMKKKNLDMPDMGSTTKSMPRPLSPAKKGSFYDNLKTT